jgi:hypothetical protein
LPVIRLSGFLPEQLRVRGKGIEQLIVEVVAVGNHQHGRIIQSWHDLAGIKNHRQRFAAALSMPDHTGFFVAPGLLFHAGQAVTGWVFLDLRRMQFASTIRRAQGRGDSDIHGVILMISGKLFYRADADDAGLRMPQGIPSGFAIHLIFLFGLLEHHEMPDQVEQRGFVQHAVDQSFKLADRRRGFDFAVNRFSCHEPAKSRRQRPWLPDHPKSPKWRCR